MQISIIIPIYKVEKYLRECLESIKTQNFQDYEVLMINDGSPDNSEVICKEFAAGDARFKYIRQENQGVSAARNKGLSQARGKYVYFMDPDDTFSPDFLEALYNEAEAGGADIVLNNSVLIGLSPRKVLQLKDIPNGCYDADIRNYFVDGYLWYKLFRKETIDQAQIAFLPGCRFREDELFGMMLYPYCRKFSVIRQGYYYYRQHGESALASVLKIVRLIVKRLPAIWKQFFVSIRNADLMNISRLPCVCFHIFMSGIIPAIIGRQCSN